MRPLPLSVPQLKGQREGTARSKHFWRGAMVCQATSGLLYEASGTRGGCWGSAWALLSASVRACPVLTPSSPPSHGPCLFVPSDSRDSAGRPTESAAEALGLYE